MRDDDVLQHVVSQRKKGGMSMVKKIQLFAVLGFTALAFSNAFAPLPAARASMPAHNVTAETMAALQGVWYDMDGNPVFSVDDASFNGRAILGATNYAGPKACEAELCLAGEAGAPPSIVNVSWTPGHRFMTMEGKTYRATAEEEYFESVGGIFLGMKTEDMLSHRDEPPQAASLHYYEWSDMSVRIMGGIVTEIFLVPGGASLDRSGLGAEASLADFQAAYGWTEDGPEAVSREIGPCQEYLCFDKYPERVVLSLYLES